MFTRLLSSFFAIQLLLPSIAFSMRDSTDITYVKPMDYRYLWYGEIKDKFDSLTVIYQIGEFRIHSSQGTSDRLLMQLSESQWRNENLPSSITEGSPVRGCDVLLENTIVTKPFIAPPHGAVSFYRMVAVEQKCTESGNSSYPVDPNADVPTTWREVQLSLQDAGILPDTSSFIVELVNLTDSSIATIDSVCIMPNPGNMLVATGGTDAVSTMFSVALPASAWGDSVYLRAVPYRWGSSPLGMTSAMIHSSFSMSTLYKGMPSTLSAPSRLINHPTFYDTLMHWILDDLIAYHESDSARICAPVLFESTSLPEPLMNVYLSYKQGRGYLNDYWACAEV